MLSPIHIDHHLIATIKDTEKYQQFYHLVKHHDKAEILMMIAYVSDYSHHLMIKYWQDIQGYLDTENPQYYLSKIQQESQHITDIDTLRSYKEYNFLLISLADYLGISDMPSLCGYLSDIAIFSCHVVLRHVLEEFYHYQQWAVDKDNIMDGICIFAMGKLGANMLNFSSDIDIIFIYDNTKISCAHHDVQNILRRIVTKFINIMQEFNNHGRLFRVDIRLSPDMGMMPFAISYDSALNYYGSIARSWERMAMMKATPIAGDIALGQYFLKEISPFIWRREIDIFAHQEAMAVRKNIKEYYKQQFKTFKGLDIKRCHGGIRDIEFSLQSLQMIWAGRIKALQTPSIIDLCHIACEHDLLSKDISEKLLKNYWFLRRIEHHIQMENDQQSYTIGKDDKAIYKLAISLGFSHHQEFTQYLKKILKETISLCDSFYQDNDSKENHDDNITILYHDFSDPDCKELTISFLEKYHYNDVEKLYHMICQWYQYPLLRFEKSRLVFRSLLPKLLKIIGEDSSRDMGIYHLDHLLQYSQGRISFFAILDSHHTLLEKFCHILTKLRFFGEQLLRDNGLLDILLINDHPISDKKYIEDYFTLSDTVARYDEEKLNFIIRYLQELRIRNAYDYILHKTSLYDFSDNMTIISDVALQHIVETSILFHQQDNGYIANSGFVVIALGSWATSTMRIYSDLDMMIVFDSDGEQDTDISKYYNRLAMKIQNNLNMPSKYGKAFHIDLRLRPDSVSVPLATSYDRVCYYYLHDQAQAWVAEYHALENARIAYASRPESSQKIEKLLDDIHHYHIEEPTLSAQTADVIHKMRQANPPNDAHQQTKQFLKEIDIISSYARRSSQHYDKALFQQYHDMLHMLLIHFQAHYGEKYADNDFLAYCTQAQNTLKDYYPISMGTVAIDNITSYLDKIKIAIDHQWQQFGINVNLQ